jgi:hypothetical protein
MEMQTNASYRTGPGMHTSDDFAALGITDHDDDSAKAGPKKVPLTNFKKQCICRNHAEPFLLDGSLVRAYCPLCEQPGHGARSKYTTNPGDSCAEKQEASPTRKKKKNK